MKTLLVMTITCPDQPGVVERITAAMSGFAANWEESRMARLGGDFAGIVKITVMSEQADALIAALRRLANDQTSITIKTTTPTSSEQEPPDAMCELTLEGADHEGIVHTVSAYLAGRGINVEAMETDVVPAPMSGAPVFRMRARINVPGEISVDDLRGDLAQIGDQLGVDIDIQPLPPV